MGFYWGKLEQTSSSLFFSRSTMKPVDVMGKTNVRILQKMWRRQKTRGLRTEEQHGNESPGFSGCLVNPRHPQTEMRKARSLQPNDRDTGGLIQQTLTQERL